MTDDRDQWVSEYSERLQNVLTERHIDLPAGAVEQFVQHMVTTVADTAGINERDARLTIQPAAVNAWATILTQLHEMTSPEPEIVALSGVIAVRVLHWVSSALPIIREVAVDGTPTEILNQLEGNANEVAAVAVLESVVGDLEVAMPADGVHLFARAFEIVGDWLCDPETGDTFNAKAAALPMDSPTRVHYGKGGDLSGMSYELGSSAHNLSVDLASTHRHIFDTEEVLNYDDLAGMFSDDD